MSVKTLNLGYGSPDPAFFTHHVSIGSDSFPPPHPPHPLATSPFPHSTPPQIFSSLSACTCTWFIILKPDPLSIPNKSAIPKSYTGYIPHGMTDGWMVIYTEAVDQWNWWQKGHSHWAWKLAKLGWKLPSNCTKFHPKLRKSECDFSNFARCFVMRMHTAEKLWFYSRDFRIRSSFSARLNVRAAVSEFCIQYSCTYYTAYICSCAGNGWTSKLDMRSSSRNFTIFSSELTSRVFGVMRTRSVKHREFSCRDFL